MERPHIESIQDKTHNPFLTYQLAPPIWPHYYLGPYFVSPLAAITSPLLFPSPPPFFHLRLLNRFTDIRLSLSKNEELLGCFLDISAAYDNVLLPVLRAKMLHLSIAVKIVQIVSKLFIGRSIKIRDGNSYLPPRTLWQGLPQGSVLSPILYSIYTYDLEQSVLPFCNILQYADDLVLYASAKSIDTAATRLNMGLSYLKDWLEEHGLSLSPSKSCAVTFSRRRNMPIADVHFGEENIPNAESTKFLGVVLDWKMCGKQHLVP